MPPALTFLLILTAGTVPRPPAEHCPHSQTAKERRMKSTLIDLANDLANYRANESHRMTRGEFKIMTALEAIMRALAS